MLTRPLIVFDLDGTIVDSHLDLAESTNEMLESYGVGPIPVESATAMIGDGVRRLVERALAATGLDPAEPEAVDRFAAIYARRLLVHTRPYEGLAALIGAAATEAALAVLTNKPEAPTRRILDAFALTSAFACIVGGDSGFARKPDPAGLVHVCRHGRRDGRHDAPHWRLERGCGDRAARWRGVLRGPLRVWPRGPGPPHGGGADRPAGGDPDVCRRGKIRPRAWRVRMNRIGWSLVVVMGIAVVDAGVGARQATPPPARPPSASPTNDLPNPYTTIADWAKMPDGRTWGSTSAVDIDKDGTSIWVAERCGTNSCAGSSLPAVLHFDASGNLLSSFGANLFISPHGILMDRDGNVWVIDCGCTGGTGGPRGAPAAARANGPGAAAGAQGASDFQVQARWHVDPDARQGRRRTRTGVLLSAERDGVREGRIDLRRRRPRLTAGIDRARHEVFQRRQARASRLGRSAPGPISSTSRTRSAFDSRGRLFVGDRDNNRIQIFDQDFKLLDTWTQFSRPSGVVIDAHDVLYVADSESESISRGNGMTGHEGWRRGIRIGSAKDGSVSAFIPDPVETTTGTSAGRRALPSTRTALSMAPRWGRRRRLKRYVKR